MCVFMYARVRFYVVVIIGVDFVGVFFVITFGGEFGIYVLLILWLLFFLIVFYLWFSRANVFAVESCDYNWIAFYIVFVCFICISI